MPDQPNLPSDQVLSSLHEKLKAHTTLELVDRATELVDALLGLAQSMRLARPLQLLPNILRRLRKRHRKKRD